MSGKLSTLFETSLACIAGVSFVILACIGVINAYSPVPFWDMWDGVVFFQTRVSDGDLTAFVAQHVNHRTVVSNVLFYLDQVLFGGGHAFLFLSSLLILGGIVGLISWLCRLIMPEREHLKLVLVVAGLSSALCFSWIQRENLTWAFQNQMYAVQLFPMLAVMALVKSTQAEGLAGSLWFTLAVIAAFVSPYTMMSGLFILPLLVGAAFFFRLSWTRICILVAISAAAIALYFIGYKNPDIQKEYAGSFFNHVPEFAQFALTLIGGPAYYFPGVGGSTLALAIGAIMVTTALVMIAQLCWRSNTRWIGIVFLVLLTYQALTATGIAVGRSGLGMDQSITSRYMTTSLVTWAIFVTLVVYFFREFFSRPLAALIPLAPLLLFFPLQKTALDVTVEPRMERLGGALALELGVNDPAQIGHIWPFFESISILTQGAKIKNFSIFGSGMLKDAAEMLGGPSPKLGPTPCEGRIFSTDSVTGDERFQRLVGIVRSESGAGVPDALAIADATGKVVGYAVTSRSILGVGLSQPAMQFIGYVQNRRAPGELQFIPREGGCSFASSVGPAKEGMLSAIDGDFTLSLSWEGPGGGPPSPGLKEAKYSFKAMTGARSREWLPVTPGDKFAVDYAVQLLKPSSNGKPPRYVVGAMFLDHNGGVISWGSIEPPLTEPSRSSHIEATAPEGSTRVHLYLSGMWGPEMPPNGELAYTRAILSAISRAPTSQ